jgi:hypothetical protein
LIPPNSDIEQPFSQREAANSPEGSGKQLVETSDDKDIPIFCAGGCGEVVGHLRKGQRVFASKARGGEQWCPVCKEAIASKKCAEESVSLANTDELAELRKPARDLGWLGLIQAATVAIIIAGSFCIAMGRAVGIYLAAFGTLAWFAECLVLRKLRD